MAYVALDQNGDVTGVFAQPQQAIAGFTKIPDDDARLAAWSAQKSIEQKSKLQLLIDALIAADVLKTDPTL
jgi:hypothetical protein